MSNLCRLLHAHQLVEDKSDAKDSDSSTDYEDGAAATTTAPRYLHVLQAQG